jgi:hypothetical protein
MKLLIILLAALVAPAGLAICATGVAAVVMKRRRKQKEDEQAREARLKRLHKHRDGQVAGRQEQEMQLQLEGRRQGVKQSWRSVDGTSWVPGIAPGPAMLRRSNAGSVNGSDELTEGDLALQQQQSLSQQQSLQGLQYCQSAGTSIERLQPGETGFGSMPGGVMNRFAAMVTLPPGRDSVDGFTVAESSFSAAARPRGNRWSLAGSVAGMASSVATVLHLRWVKICCCWCFFCYKL